MSGALRPPTTPRLPEGRRIPASTTKSLLAYTASGCRNGANRQRLVATAFCHDRRNGPLPGRTISSGSNGQGVVSECPVHPPASCLKGRAKHGVSKDDPNGGAVRALWNVLRDAPFGAPQDEVRVEA